MTTIHSIRSNAQSNSQLSQYVTLLQSCMTQHGDDVLEVHPRLLKQEKQLSRQSFQMIQSWLSIR